MRLTPRRLKALRAMSEEFFVMLNEADPDDMEAGMQIAIAGGALAGMVPELLDEIERLRNGTPAAPTRMLKMDARGGTA